MQRAKVFGRTLEVSSSLISPASPRLPGAEAIYETVQMVQTEPEGVGLWC